MATVGFEPLVVTDGRITFGANDHSATVTGVTFNPTVTVVRHRGLSKSSERKRVTADWSMDTNLDIDLETAQALVPYLIAQRGEEVAVVVTPEDGGSTIETTVTVPAFPLGFTAEQLASTSVSFPCTEPELVPAV